MTGCMKRAGWGLWMSLKPSMKGYRIMIYIEVCAENILETGARTEDGLLTQW